MGTNKTGLECLKNPTPLRNDTGPLSGLQRNALASLVQIVAHTQQFELGMQVALRIEARHGAGIVPNWGRVLEAFWPGLVCVLFSAPALRQMKFFQKLFPTVDTVAVRNVPIPLCTTYSVIANKNQYWTYNVQCTNDQRLKDGQKKNGEWTKMRQWACKEPMTDTHKTDAQRNYWIPTAHFH